MPSVNLARERSLYKAYSEHAIKARNSDLTQLQEQLSTGLRVNRPSDDPLAYGQARRLENLGDRYSQYQRSISSARTWVDHTQAALDQVGELFTQAYEQGVRFANGTHSASDRTTAVTSLTSLLGTVVDQLNSQVNGEYLFAGSRTTVQPFTLAGTSVTYDPTRIDGGRQRTIGPGASLNINIAGTDLVEFDPGSGPSTITTTLENLLTAVQSGNPTQLDTALQELIAARDHVIERSAEAGTIGERLQLAERQLNDAALVAEGRRSAYEEVDYADTLMRFQQAQTGLQAALKVSADILQTSLLDYLR